MLGNITHARLSHNPAAALARALVAAAACLAVAGCGGRTEPSPPTPSNAPAVAGGASVEPARPPAEGAGHALVVDRSAADAYFELAAKLARGRTVSTEAFAELCARPAYADLLAMLDNRLLNPGILENVVRYLYAPDGDRIAGGSQTAKSGDADDRDRTKQPPKRKDLIDALGYTRDHADSVKTLFGEFANSPGAQRLHAMLTGYVRPQRLPDTLRVRFLLAGPDIRWNRGAVLVDGGLAAAAGIDLLPHLMAAQLYDALEPLDGPDPVRAGSGKAALAATFAKLRQRAVIAWLEEYPTVSFDYTHPLLGRTDRGRLEWSRRGHGALAQMQEMLVPLLADRPTLDQQGTALDDLLRGNGAYDATGCVMAALIAARFGEDRLREVSRGSPTAFFEAYQEAALMQGPLATEPLGDRPWLTSSDLADLPPFAENIWRPLLAVLDPKRAAGR